MERQTASTPVANAKRDATSPAFNPLDYPAGFLQPTCISEVSAWLQHIPFAFSLTQMLRPLSFVELGTHKGDSYLAFCQAVAALNLPTKCYAVDTWAGDEYSGFYGESVYTDLVTYHDKHYAGFSRLIRSTFDEAVPCFADSSIDLLHIDGLHTYDAVKHDFETWQPKLSAKAVVLFHDINVRERGFGVWRYWDELRERFPSFSFTHGNGLGVLAVGGNCPKSLAPLLRLEESNAVPIRQFYFLLGNRIETVAHLIRRLASESGKASSHLQILRNVVSALDEALESVGYQHDRLVADADAQQIVQHAVWTHRGLTKLSQDVRERDLNIKALNTQLQSLQTTLNARHEQLQDVNSRISAQNKRLAELSNGNVEKQKRVVELITERDRLHLNLASRAQDKERLLDQLDELAQSHMHQRAIMQELQMQLAHLRRIDAEKEQLIEHQVIENRSMQSRLDAELGHVGQLQMQLAHLRQIDAEKEQLNHDLDAENHALHGRMEQLESHAANLEQGMRAIRTSFSWKVSAPLRLIGRPFSFLLKGGVEQKLHRAYYSLPGMSQTRKRALILWLHRHASFLTKNTVSYRLHEQARNVVDHQTESKGT